MGPLCPRVGELWRKKIYEGKSDKKNWIYVCAIVFPLPQRLHKKRFPDPLWRSCGYFFFFSLLIAECATVSYNFRPTFTVLKYPQQLFLDFACLILKFSKTVNIRWGFLRKVRKGYFRGYKVFQLSRARKMYSDIFWILEGFPLIVRKNICICNSMIILIQRLQNNSIWQT